MHHLVIRELVTDPRTVQTLVSVMHTGTVVQAVRKQIGCGISLTAGADACICMVHAVEDARSLRAIPT